MTDLPPNTPSPKRANWFLRIFLFLMIAPPLGMAAWIWLCFQFVYSSGERVGFMQKLSHRGWICKTHEGQLAMVNLPGQPAELFAFTVRDDRVARDLDKYAGKRVRIYYEQHRGLPTDCFGDTQYFVKRVQPDK